MSQLGGLITSKVKIKRNFIDLELFFLEATNCVFNDTRLTRCIEYWVLKHGQLLSPQRLQKIIESKKIQFDESVLGALLGIIDPKFPNKCRFSPLAKFCSKKANIPLFPFFKDVARSDKRWLRYGIIAPEFKPQEENHFLISEKKQTTIPELFFRKSAPPVVANIQSYLKLNPSTSIYRISKELGVTYAYTYNVCKKFRS